MNNQFGNNQMNNPSGYDAMNNPSGNYVLNNPFGDNVMNNPSGNYVVDNPFSDNMMNNPSGYNVMDNPSGYNQMNNPSGSNVMNNPSGFVLKDPFVTKMPPPGERLSQLELLEKDLATACQAAGQTILELSKEKPSVKQCETFSQTFLKTLENVENGLSENITYLTQVSTGQAHEGSSYASQKMMQMAWHRLKHSQSRLTEMERLKNVHIQENNALVGATAKRNPPESS